MISQSQNRVQAIKSKFENLNAENVPRILKKRNTDVLQFSKQNDDFDGNFDKENNSKSFKDNSENDSGEERVPNVSYLYSDTKKVEVKKALTRQSSDPGKKLHRSHAFRCDRNQKIGGSPKRHGSCYGRSETSDFTLKMGEKKLSKDRLKRLGNLLEDQMRKENFKVSTDTAVGEVRIIKNDPQLAPENDLVPINSIPDSEVPQHILDQYAKVIKTRKKDDKHDAMTDSGVSSETENLDEERIGRTKKLVSQFEKQDQEPAADTNLEVMNDLCASSETMRLERKNPHLILTDTLKKALKQPLPPGPPPKKPPRLLTSPIPESPVKEKKDAKKMLQKLEQALLKREALNQSAKNVYDIAEADLSLKKPKVNQPSKEMHYLCTEILDITHRTLLPNQNKDSNCFKLNCANLTHSTTSLPYTRLSMHTDSPPCACTNDSERLSTFFNDSKCVKCHTNEERHGFKCHLNCHCRKSEFYIEKEHIYDEPCIGKDDCVVEKKNNYGSLNFSLNKSFSKSLEDLRNNRAVEQNQKIYDIPCDVSRPSTPDLPKSDFEKLRNNFEKGFSEQPKNTDKPAVLTPKPNFVKNKFSKSSENLTDDFKNAKRLVEKKFATEGKKSGKSEGNVKLCLPKKDNQLDIDRENLNRLMNEIYNTVTAACNMEENKPGSFPTEQSDGNTSEDSVKLTRSLTEKRKNYVRRVSSRVAYLDQNNIRSQTAKRYRNQTSICSIKSEIIDKKDTNPYYTFRSWKSFRTSQVNLNKMDATESKDMINGIGASSAESIDNLSIDEKTGCVDIKLPFEPREKGLFNVCMLVGLNYMTGQAYVKSVFPSQVKVPPHIENLVFPETLSWSGQRGEWSADAQAQCYSLVLTDELGERNYGYCRRVLPEGATTCLPLCYCVIGKYRAPGFYYKVLQEIESHHGSSEQEIQSLLQQLIETDFPNPGEIITIKKSLTDKHTADLDVCKSKTMPDLRRSEGRSNEVEESMENMELPKYLDVENNNAKRVTLHFDVNRPKIIKRPIEPRVDEDNLSVLLDTLGAGLVLKVFGSLLLERKVIIISDKLSLLSSCMEALQSALYPLVWQQPLISCIPREIQRDVLEAPLPILAGMLHDSSVNTQQRPFDEGMLIDLTNPSKVLVYVGDESTILPTSSYKTLKTSLQMESIKYKDKSEDSKTRNVLISEAFLRFFVDILGDFWRFFSLGEVKEGGLGKGGVVFDKEAFIKSATSKQNQYFLDWFAETAMFNHFIQNMALCYHTSTSPNTSNSSNWPKIDYNTVKLVDTPLPEFYQLYEERIRNRQNSDSQKNSEKNYKSAVNKKVKLLKSKLRDLIT